MESFTAPGMVHKSGFAGALEVLHKKKRGFTLGAAQWLHTGKGCLSRDYARMVSRPPVHATQLWFTVPITIASRALWDICGMASHFIQQVGANEQHAMAWHSQKSSRERHHKLRGAPQFPMNGLNSFTHNAFGFASQLASHGL